MVNYELDKYGLNKFVRRNNHDLDFSFSLEYIVIPPFFFLSPYFLCDWLDTSTHYNRSAVNAVITWTASSHSARAECHNLFRRPDCDTEEAIGVVEWWWSGGGAGQNRWCEWRGLTTGIAVACARAVVLGKYFMRSPTVSADIFTLAGRGHSNVKTASTMYRFECEIWTGSQCSFVGEIERRQDEGRGCVGWMYRGILWWNPYIQRLYSVLSCTRSTCIVE